MSRAVIIEFLGYKSHDLVFLPLVSFSLFVVQALFRVDVPTFNYIHKKVRRALRPRRRNKRGRRPIPTELVIATALLHLSTGNTYGSTANMIEMEFQKYR